MGRARDASTGSAGGECPARARVARRSSAAGVGATLPGPMAVHALASDRDYCRAVLPRVSRTFAINIRLLNGGLGEAVRAGYLLCRAADTLEDAWTGSDVEIGARFDLFEAALGGDAPAAEALARGAARVSPGSPELDLLAHLPRVLDVARSLPAPDREALAECVRTMSAGMRRYATRAAGRRAGAQAARPGDERTCGRARPGSTARGAGARGARASARLPRSYPGGPGALPALLPVAGAVGAGLARPRAQGPGVPVGAAPAAAAARHAVGVGAALARVGARRPGAAAARRGG